jgi:hypothetical protein
VLTGALAGWRTSITSCPVDLRRLTVRDLV